MDECVRMRACACGYVEQECTYVHAEVHVPACMHPCVHVLCMCACAMQACAMYASAMYACAMHACAMHACAMYACV